MGGILKFLYITRKNSELLLSQKKLCLTNFYKKCVGRYFWRFFSQTHLVTLIITFTPVASSPMDGHPPHLLHGRPFYVQPSTALQPPPKSKAERPSSLGSVIGIHPAANSAALPAQQATVVKFHSDSESRPQW
jgi:hypothetical protein